MKMSDVIEYLNLQIKYGDRQIYIVDENEKELPMYAMLNGTYKHRDKMAFVVEPLWLKESDDCDK